MPIEKLHKEKKKKNLAILGAIAAWVVIIFVVTVIKVTTNG